MPGNPWSGELQSNPGLRQTGMVEDLDEGSTGDAQLQCGRDKSSASSDVVVSKCGRRAARTGCGEDARGHSKAPKDVMPRQWVHFRSSSRFPSRIVASPSALPLCSLSWLLYACRASLLLRNAHSTCRISPRCLQHRGQHFNSVGCLP